VIVCFQVSYCVALLCGAFVWGYCVALLCGATVWPFCVGLLCGPFVWGYSVALVCGATVWLCNRCEAHKINHVVHAGHWHLFELWHCGRAGPCLLATTSYVQASITLGGL